VEKGLCSSAWTNAYLTVSSGLIATTGSLHAKAITNVVQYNIAMSTALGPDPPDEAIEAYVDQMLAKGLILPGYGHAVLRCTDPRLEFITRFVDSHGTPSPVRRGSEATPTMSLKLMNRTHVLIPKLLRTRVPRIKNPAPNVDALSGCVLHAYGIESKALVLFMACGRMPGFLAQYVWDRALGLPLERPLSLTMDELLVRAKL